MRDPLDNLRGETDHEILLVIASEMRHMRNHTAELATEAAIQNGRIAALEKMRWWFAGVLAVVVPLSPLLIYEVRQSVFNFAGG